MLLNGIHKLNYLQYLLELFPIENYHITYLYVIKCLILFLVSLFEDYIYMILNYL